MNKKHLKSCLDSYSKGKGNTTGWDSGSSTIVLDQANGQANFLATSGEKKLLTPLLKELQWHHVHVTEKPRDCPYAPEVLNAPIFSHWHAPTARRHQAVGKCFLNGFNQSWTMGKQMGSHMTQPSICVTRASAERQIEWGKLNSLFSLPSLFLLLDTSCSSGSVGSRLLVSSNQAKPHFAKFI